MINENICLYGVISGSRWKQLVTRTGLRSLCMISIVWRYCSPLATSASFSHVSGSGDFWGRTEIGRTRQRRLTSGCLDMKSTIFPSIIHLVMMHNENSFGETPNTVRMFGWERRLQIGISWNKFCNEPSDVYMPWDYWVYTCLILNRFSAAKIRNALMHTRFPLWWPSQTSANPLLVNAMSPSFVMLSERMQERGRMDCKPQTFRTMRKIVSRRSSSISGSSKAYAWDQTGFPHHLPQLT